MATYHVENFGCRATQADGAAIERQLLDRGLQRAGAASRSRSRRPEYLHRHRLGRSGRARRHPPHSSRKSRRQILVTGCYAQRAPEELSALPGVSLVVGNSHKHELANYVVSAGQRHRISFRWRKLARRRLRQA